MSIAVVLIGELDMVMRVKVRDLEVLELYQLLLQTYKSKPFREENSAYNDVVAEYTNILGSASYNAVQWFFTNTSKALRKGCRSMSIKTRASYWT